MNEQLYRNWICEVKGKLSQTDFGKQIKHYQNEKDTKECKTYGRTEVSNWITGKSLPKDKETCISIALFDFDKKNPMTEKTITDRNMRYKYVREKINLILGIDLYCRNIHDLLLIQVCRDVISFEEVLELEPQLEALLQDISLGSKERQKYALEKQTQNISGNLLKIKTKEEIFEIVEEAKLFFYTGNRVLGERFKKCFEERNRYVKPLCFEEAFRIYAPNYRNSFRKLFTSSGHSREWILDMCVHLRFNRAEIQYVLENAHVIPLSDETEDMESGYDDIRYPIGSVEWYQYMEQQYPLQYKGHFWEFQSMTLVEKFQIAVLLCSCVKDMYGKELPPADYILESFLFYKCGKDAMKKVNDLLKTVSLDSEWDTQALQHNLEDNVESWILYVQSGFFSIKNQALQKVYEDYRKEFSNYFSYEKHAIAGLKEDAYAVQLKYIAAVLYTVFTGKYYRNQISEADLEMIKSQLEDKVEDWKIIYNFLTQFFVTFLNNEVLYEKVQGAYYTVIDSEKTRVFDMEEVYTDFWEALIILTCTK